MSIPRRAPMRSAALALAVSVTLAGAAAAQTRPDFSGVWRLDVARSNTAAHSTAVPRQVTLEIRQDGTEIEILTRTPEGENTLKYAIAQTDKPTLAATTG